MVFLNPWLFWGLAATVMVPVVLHLIMRQSPKHVIFPALQFLRQRKEANRRRLRFRHLLLLALRMAVLLFLAAALCRPNIGCSGIRKSKEGPVTAALVVDTSASMLYEQQNQTRLAVAQETARWLLEKLPEQSQVAVFDLESETGAFEVDARRARERLELLQPTVKPDALLDVAARAVELLKSGTHEAKELYIFTDLSRGEWAAERAGRLLDRLREVSNVGIYVIDVGSPNPQNTSLGEMRLSAETAARNSTITIEQAVSRIGEPFKSQVGVTIHDAVGRPVNPPPTAEVSLKPDDSQTLSFKINGLSEPGTYYGVVKVLNSEGNLLTIDDARYFTIEVKPPWPVLIIAPTPAEAYAWDLQQYLSPARHRAENRQRFACTIKNEDELPGMTAKDLAQFAAICLLDPRPLPKAEWEKLAAYATQGGSVAVFLGRNAEQRPESFNEPAPQAVLAGKLMATTDWSEGVHLDPSPFKHKMLEYFRTLNEPLPWDAFWVRRAWQLEKVADAEVVVPFSNKQPAVLLRQIGKGHAVTMTTPVSDELDESAWNTLTKEVATSTSILPPRPFVGLANEIMLYLVGAMDQRLHFMPGETVRLLLPPGQVIDSRYKLVSPTGEEAFHPPPEPDAGAITETARQVGHWRVQRLEAPEDQQLNRGFSVNLPTEESILARAGEDDLKVMFGENPVNLARNRDEINRKLTATRVGHELFPLLIVFVALVLGAEHLLANRFYRHEEDETRRVGPARAASAGPPSGEMTKSQ